MKKILFVFTLLAGVTFASSALAATCRQAIEAAGGSYGTSGLEIADDALFPNVYSGGLMCPSSQVLMSGVTSQSGRHCCVNESIISSVPKTPDYAVSTPEQIGTVTAIGGPLRFVPAPGSGYTGTITNGQLTLSSGSSSGGSSSGSSSTEAQCQAKASGSYCGSAADMIKFPQYRCDSSTSQVGVCNNTGPFGVVDEPCCVPKAALCTQSGGRVLTGTAASQTGCRQDSQLSTSTQRCCFPQPGHVFDPAKGYYVAAGDLSSGSGSTPRAPLAGGEGSDTLNGGAGSDTLDGSATCAAPNSCVNTADGCPASKPNNITSSAPCVGETGEPLPGRICCSATKPGADASLGGAGGDKSFLGSTELVEISLSNPLKYDTVEGVLTSIMSGIQTIVVTLALLMIVIGGVMYILSAGNEGRMKVAKNIVLAALIGLAIVIAAPAFLKEISVLLGWDSAPAIEGGTDLTLTQIAMNILKFLLSIIGILALIMMIISGIMYLTSGGNDARLKQAKGIFVAALIGITVAMASLVLVTAVANFFI